MNLGACLEAVMHSFSYNRQGLWLLGWILFSAFLLLHKSFLNLFFFYKIFPLTSKCYIIFLNFFRESFLAVRNFILTWILISYNSYQKLMFLCGSFAAVGFNDAVSVTSGDKEHVRPGVETFHCASHFSLQWRCGEEH